MSGVTRPDSADTVLAVMNNPINMINALLIASLLSSLHVNCILIGNERFELRVKMLLPDLSDCVRSTIDNHRCPLASGGEPSDRFHHVSRGHGRTGGDLARRSFAGGKDFHVGPAHVDNQHLVRIPMSLAVVFFSWRCPLSS
jgi:hypothetical protein